MADPQTDVSKLSFEDALGELERIVRQLESGQVKLDDAVGAYERGSRLRAHCEGLLKDARAKVEKITGAEGGAPTGTEPFDPES